MRCYRDMDRQIRMHIKLLVSRKLWQLLVVFFMFCDGNKLLKDLMETEKVSEELEVERMEPHGVGKRLERDDEVRGGDGRERQNEAAGCVRVVIGGVRAVRLGF